MKPTLLSLSLYLSLQETAVLKYVNFGFLSPPHIYEIETGIVRKTVSVLGNKKIIFDD
jgi:hypothetical protein